MAIGIATPDQYKLLEPYTQRLYSGDLDYTKSYIYNFVNQLTELVGKDQIVTGLNVKTSSFTNSDISITLNDGYLIHDRSFCKFPSDITLTYPNASMFDTTGKFIVFSRYRNYISTEKNEVQICMMYINSIGNTYEPFNIDTDRIIFMAIDFTKDLSGNIDSINILQEGDIVINGQTRRIHPTKDETMIMSSLDGGQLP